MHSVPEFTAAQSTGAKLWKLPLCLSAEERIKTAWHVCVMEYYSLVKETSELYVRKRMDLESTMQEETNQTQTMKYHMVFLTREIQSVKQN